MKRADSIKHPFRYIAVAVIVIGMIGLCIWDIADPPLFWQKEAQQNQKVILEYAKEHYPNAIIVEEKYESNKLNWSANPFDYIVFEQEGVQFSILANDGRLLHDNYLTSKSYRYFETEVIENFLASRNITAKKTYSITEENTLAYYLDKTDTFFVIWQYEDGKDHPANIDWFYDLYVFWQENDNLRDIIIRLSYRINDRYCYTVEFDRDIIYSSKDDFYATFEYVELSYLNALNS